MGATSHGNNVQEEEAYSALLSPLNSDCLDGPTPPSLICGTDNDDDDLTQLSNTNKVEIPPISSSPDYDMTCSLSSSPALRGPDQQSFDDVCDSLCTTPEIGSPLNHDDPSQALDKETYGEAFLEDWEVGPGSSPSASETTRFSESLAARLLVVLRERETTDNARCSSSESDVVSPILLAFPALEPRDHGINAHISPAEITMHCTNEISNDLELSSPHCLFGSIPSSPRLSLNDVRPGKNCDRVPSYSTTTEGTQRITRSSSDNDSYTKGSSISSFSQASFSSAESSLSDEELSPISFRRRVSPSPQSSIEESFESVSTSSSRTLARSHSDDAYQPCSRHSSSSVSSSETDAASHPRSLRHGYDADQESLTDSSQQSINPSFIRAQLGIQGAAKDVSGLDSPAPLTPKITSKNRGIKRARSSTIDLADDEADEVSISVTNIPQSPELPLRKKLRRAPRPSSFRQNDSTSPVRSDDQFATVPASLRKASSLRSDLEGYTSESNVQPLSVSTPPTKNGIPTVPNSPESQFVPPGRKPTRTPRLVQGFRSPVPIIAPPEDHFAQLPLSDEAQAKLRLKRFVERESRSRTREDLNRDAAIVVGLVDVDLPGDSNVRRRVDWEQVLGIGAELRSRAIDWILHVLPDQAQVLEHFRVSSKNPSRQSVSRNLLDQLSKSPETRFHAAHMFLRYFRLVMVVDEPAEDAERDGWNLVVLDTAAGCLAISVKLHRDTLWPLNPVHADEFVLLGEHEFTYEDLEAATRDVIEAFSGYLGDSPQPILDEVWLALPSLRQMLDFEGGWVRARKDIWGRLLEAVREPDVLRFPMTLLTAAALVDALISTLLERANYLSEWNGETRRLGLDAANEVASDVRKKHRQPAQALHERRRVRMSRKIEGVVYDLQAVLGIADDDLKTCRNWFAELKL
ncbi:hypothetical protein HGRIS_011070 [Hohenbuehelia grisea]|uniref:Uncharacterized protein n=1 Tax=Hohenbuehelia grisea TaxID=104357 RepID=A0ABR3IYW5_9AGAR